MPNVKDDGKFYVIKRTMPNEAESYLSSSPFGRWMIGPACLVTDLVILGDMEEVEIILRDIDGAAVALEATMEFINRRSPQMQLRVTQKIVARRDLAGKVTIGAVQKQTIVRNVV